MRHRRYPHSRRAGFMFADMMTAIVLVGAMAAAMALTMTARNRAAQRLADDRSAQRVAERTLVQLRDAQSPPEPSEGATIEIHRLATPSGLDGQAWAQVRVKLKTGSATLNGLVPEARVRE